MRTHTLSFLMLCCLSIGIHAQDKLVIDDRSGILTESVEHILKEKLAPRGIELTNLVDFRKPCDYHYGELRLEDGNLILSIQDCDKAVIGAKNLGELILESASEEQGLLISFGIMDIVTQPGKFLLEVPRVDPVQVSEVPVKEIPKDSALANEHDTRYFFAPSARNLKKGDLYYNTVYFLLHDIQYGITDNFSMGIGTSVIGLPVYLTPKLSIPLSEKSTLAVGDMPMFGTYGTEFFGNLAYGVYTYGGSDGNITIGAGHLYTNENEITSETSSLVTNFSAMARISPYIFYLTENYVMTANFQRSAWGGSTEENFIQRNTFWYGMMGIRIVSKNRDFISWQIGMTYLVNFPGEIPRKYYSWSHNAPENARLVAFPTVTFTVKFGQSF